MSNKQPPQQAAATSTSVSGQAHQDISRSSTSTAGAELTANAVTGLPGQGRNDKVMLERWEQDNTQRGLFTTPKVVPGERALFSFNPQDTLTD
jgi:hypothetical protein